MAGFFPSNKSIPLYSHGRDTAGFPCDSRTASCLLSSAPSPPWSNALCLFIFNVDLSSSRAERAVPEEDGAVVISVTAYLYSSICLFAYCSRNVDSTLLPAIIFQLLSGSHANRQPFNKTTRAFSFLFLLLFSF